MNQNSNAFCLEMQLKISSVKRRSCHPVASFTEVWDEITYPCPNFASTTNGVWEWISNFIQQFTGHAEIKASPC